MLCPKCGQESEDVTRCVHCGADLSQEPAEADTTEWVDLVPVLTTSDEAQILVVHSLLEAEGIPCSVEGELTGFEHAGGGANLAIGPERILVPPEHAKAALELLAARDLVDVAAEEPTGPDSEVGN